MSRTLKSLACAVALSGMTAMAQQATITSSANPASGNTVITFTENGDCPNDTQHTYNYTFIWYYSPHGMNDWQQFAQSGSRPPQSKAGWSHPYAVPGVYDIKAQVPVGYAVCPNFAVFYTQTITK